MYFRIVNKKTQYKNENHLLSINAGLCVDFSNKVIPLE
jgi:hypothetical protein